MTLLPECYQVPIIDLLISLVGTAATTLTLPLVLAGPIPGAVNHAVTGWSRRSGDVAAAAIGAVIGLMQLDTEGSHNAKPRPRD